MADTKTAHTTGPGSVKTEPTPQPNKDQPAKRTFDSGIKEAAEILADVPEALNFGVHQNADRAHYYAFDAQGSREKTARKRIREILTDVYESGAYSNVDFALKLRVDELAIQAILDDEFREKHGLDN